MFRVHQFNKVELFVFMRAGRARADEHERLLAIEEEILQALELPYRVVNVAAGDLGAPAAKKYDCEGWFPSQERYRELTSTSNTTDFQARRLGIRYRDGKSLEPVHTLNGTAATDRAAARDPRELPGRRAGRAARVRRARYRHALTRRGAGAVERDGLENRCGLHGPVGSNPSPAASISASARRRAPRAL